jgi:hypothetical protein
MAAVILANRHHQGYAFQSGAQVCMGILNLSDFEPEFASMGHQDSDQQAHGMRLAST